MLTFVHEPAANDKEGPVYRNVLSKDGLVTCPHKDIQTGYDLFQDIARQYPDQELMGHRRVLGIVEEEKWVTKKVGGEQVREKKTWKYFKLSGFEWYTGRDLSTMVREIGSGLKQLGVTAKANVNLFAPTSCEWQFFSQGCFYLGASISTAYDTLGEEGLLHALNQCEVAYMFTKVDLVKTIASIADRTEYLTTVVYFGDVDSKGEEELKKLRDAKEGIRVISLDEVRALGRDHPADPQPPQPEDMACIMYTSGSTGPPKGVMLTHANIIASMGAAKKVVGKFYQPGDSILAYLPLAHILEMLVELTLMSLGTKVGYGTPRTLTNQSVRECLGDLCEMQPTLLVGVPQVWDTIRKGVLATLDKAGPVARTVFDAAYRAKWWLMQRGWPTAFLDKLVFHKVQSQTGGKLRYALSGGAGISRDSQEFLSVTLCPIIQGYGMTETSGIIALMDPTCFALRRVGPPLPSVEVKLKDVEGTEYRGAQGQGEVWVRGPSITKGYYKQDDLTKQVLTEDGWFQTGDIGEWQADGQLAIIDRLKNLVKLSHGEYVALEKLESVYKSSLLVGNLCVYADSSMTRPVALVVPNQNALASFAEAEGLTDKASSENHEHDWEHLTQLPEIRQAVLKSCLEAASQNNLASAERLSDVYVVAEEWTPQNNMLTAAQKLNRSYVVKHYKKQLDDMNSDN
ncbi:long-chain fatty acid-CoA ligase [Dispira parvispora]|uniref:Long-chain fatty acid-CoA ligase n=1 Tax=Dispira parvispora TaxID=1520584 RepID=A0A9W8AMQ0_9FUNG|nr:long-chain fatty acid-CoA ligase [Dispira parvispora]